MTEKESILAVRYETLINNLKREDSLAKIAVESHRLYPDRRQLVIRDCGRAHYHAPALLLNEKKEVFQKFTREDKEELKLKLPSYLQKSLDKAWEKSLDINQGKSMHEKDVKEAKEVSVSI